MKDLDVNVTPEKISVLGNEVRKAFRIYSRPNSEKRNMSLINVM